ncbi:MAG: FKBP-type peptidyl-prolyl cis-trans isomerase [Verrucomicrobiia bacterium]|jgi:FKBP-type peptidyl-prolyl cis-trans isomerase
MKTTICTVIICLGAAAPLFADGTNDLNDEKARVSYAIGMSLGRSMQNLQNQGFQFDVDLTARGIQDVLSSNTTLLTMEQVQQTLSTLQKEINAKQQKKREEIAATNKLVGEAFLATNKNNPGVIALPDGLQYRVITNGTGAIPTNTDLVSVNYRGKLLDGTEFDSSYRRGHPANFPVRGVIPGWTEALLKMNVGSKWQLFIPSELAYGERGRPGIPPNSVLIFEIELLSTQSAPAPATAPGASANQPLTSDIIKVPSADELKKGGKIEVIKAGDTQKAQQQ